MRAERLTFSPGTKSTSEMMTVESIYAYIFLYQYEFFKKSGRFKPIDLALITTTYFTGLVALPICAILTQPYGSIRTYIFLILFGLLIVSYFYQKKLVTREFLKRHKGRIFQFERLSLTRLRMGAICSLVVIGTLMITLFIIFIH